MGWRLKLTAVGMVGAAVGVTGLYLKNYNVTSVGPPVSTPYTETVGFKLDSGQPVQLRVSRCDLGMTSRQLILKVHGEVINMGQTEVARRTYSFPLLDAQGRLHADHAAQDTPESNSFTLRPGEKHEFATKYLLEPGAVQSSLALAQVDGAHTNKLLQVKSADAFEVQLVEGQWRAFTEARWKP